MPKKLLSKRFVQRLRLSDEDRDGTAEVIKSELKSLGDMSDAERDAIIIAAEEVVNQVRLSPFQFSYRVDDLVMQLGQFTKKLFTLKKADLPEVEVEMSTEHAKQFLPLLKKEKNRFDRIVKMLKKTPSEKRSVKQNIALASSEEKLKSFTSNIELISSVGGGHVNVLLSRMRLEMFSSEQLKILEKSTLSKQVRHLEILKNNIRSHLGTLSQSGCPTVRYLQLTANLPEGFVPDRQQVIEDLYGKVNSIKQISSENCSLVRDFELAEREHGDVMERVLGETKLKGLRDKVSGLLMQYEQAVNEISMKKAVFFKGFGGLRGKDLYMLKAFNRVFERNVECDMFEKKYLVRMLDQCIGDMALNKRLSAFGRNVRAPSCSVLDVAPLKYFLYKTRFLSKYGGTIIGKCEKALLAIQEDQDPPEKLSLREVGILSDLTKLEETLLKCQEKGLLRSSAKLRKLFHQCQVASKFMSKISEGSQLNNYFKDGDILMSHSKKSLAIKNKAPDQEAWLTQTFISKYSHAAAVFVDGDDGHSRLSHVYGGYESGKVTVSDLISADVFRINPTQLCEEGDQIKLKEKFPDGYEKKVRDLFQKKFNELQVSGQEKFLDIKNDKDARFTAGLADFSYHGHRNQAPQDYASIAQEMSGADDYAIRDKMICSEFVARNILAALYQTNKDLESETGLKNVLKLPFERENISRIHPQRLIKLLSTTGALSMLERPAILEKLIDFNPAGALRKKEEYSSVKQLYRSLRDIKVTARQDEFFEKAKEACMTFLRQEKLSENIDFEKLKPDLAKLYRKITVPTFMDWFKKFLAAIGLAKSPLIKIADKIMSTLEQEGKFQSHHNDGAQSSPERSRRP